MDMIRKWNLENIGLKLQFYEHILKLDFVSWIKLNRNGAPFKRPTHNNMKEIDRNTIESSDMVEHTFKFWFNDNEHIRSPFPEYIKPQLKKDATDLFFNWTKKLDDKAKDDLNDESIGEKFEEIIFETATKLIKTEDERITIVYPFLPRLNDKFEDEKEGDSLIIDRQLKKEGDNNFLHLKLERIESKDKWDTQIEVPL